MAYDALVVLGSQPDPETWKFPDHIYKCLERSKELLESGLAPLVVTSGKWSIALDNKGIEQPFLECDAAAEYLVSQGVAKDNILKEGESKDSISNLYHLKKDIFIPRDVTNLLFVVAEFRASRLSFLCERILGEDYNVDFDSIPAEPSPSYNEPNTSRVQQEFLEPMKPGDHEWLADKFYTAPMYQYWAQHDAA